MKHDGKVTISTLLDNTGLLKGIKSISGSLGGLTSVCAKAAAGITVAFGAAAVAVTKQAADAYAEYEQLAGGIETLFKSSASKVKDYAEDAFYTTGVSANKYMEIVTGFSASLISSLSGDTEKAADVANTALVDMSDNANKMGSTLESVQEAYKSFSKQQYQLLDNLKLGYGGTKTEMERLLKDAEAFSGVKYNINSLADVYSAIHAIQEKLGIAGATAEEAEKTITGSANLTKAAWQNVLAAISGGGDLDKAINNLVYSISKYFENIVPVVERSLSGIGQLIERIAPQLVQTVAASLIKAIPSLLNAVYQMIIGLAKGIYQGIISLFTGGSFTSEVTAQLNSVTESADAAADAESELASGIEEAAKAAKRSTAGFDELNKLQDNTGSANSSGISLGQSAGSVTTNVTVGGDVKDNVSPVLQNVIAKIKALANKIKSLFQPTFTAWGTAFSGLAPTVEGTGARISTAWNELKVTSLVPFGEYLTTNFVPGVANTFSTTFAPIFADVMPAAMNIWATDFENKCLVIQKALGWLITAFEFVKNVFTDMCESISIHWDTYGGKLLQGFTEFKEGLWDTWWYIYDNIIDPVLTSCAETFDWLWDKHLKPLWDNAVEFVLSVGENILALWNKFIKPVADYLVALFAPVVTNVISRLVDWFSIAVATVSDLIAGAMKYLDGLIQFITGVFTLDWERAWGGIKKMFEGAWNGMIAIAKGVVNSVIWTINTLISALYSGIAGVVNGVGSIVKNFGELLGKDWSFSIPTKAPKIPYLAKGAVLPANKPFLAMVGDQRHGTNIEAPLSTIQEAVALVMEDQLSAMMAGFNALLEENRMLRRTVEGIEIGDSTIGQAADRYRRQIGAMTGG